MLIEFKVLIVIEVEANLQIWKFLKTIVISTVLIRVPYRHYMKLREEQHYK